MKNNLILKKRTEGTIKAIEMNLKNVSSEELIVDLFVETNSDIALKLIKLFESTLIKASMDKKYLNKNLHNFFLETSLFLKKNNLYEEFIDFAYFIYSNLSNKNINIFVLSAFQDLLLQQFCYLVPSEKVVCGIDTKGNLLTINELFPCLDYAFYDLEKKEIKSQMDIINAFRKYGYDASNIDNINYMIYNEMIITNMTILMSKFINENTIDIIPEKYFFPSSRFEYIREWKNTEFYRELLKRRKYVLPSDGVLGIYKNAGCIYSIFFKELFLDDQIYLLYKVENLLEEGFYGIYDTKTDFFYSIFKDSTGEGYNKVIENFVLESYCHLTTDIEIDRKRNMALKVVDNIEDDIFYYPEQPMVEFSFFEKRDGVKGRGVGIGRKKFDKTKYKEESININPFIRKLPEGMSASKEAIERARELGYELLEGETFVRGFTRRNYILKNNFSQN